MSWRMMAVSDVDRFQVSTPETEDMTRVEAAYGRS
jgi:hypothetical protein